MLVATPVPKTYVCEFCGKEFTRDELQPVFGKDESNPLHPEMVFCSRNCFAEYEHSKDKDW